MTRKIRSFSIKNTVKRFQLRFFVLFFVILIIPLKNSYSLPKCSKQDLIDKTFVGVRDVYLHNCTGMVAKEEGYYDGEWRHNNYNGKGKYFWLDNYDYYEGDFKDGEMHGQGLFNFTELDEKYIGEWKNGLAHGIGKHIFGPKSKFPGDLIEGIFRNDNLIEGTYTFSNGNVYKGKFKKGQFHGKGILTYPNGDKFYADFIHGEFHGKGTKIYSNGDKLEGEYKFSKKHGKLTLYYKNGDIRESTYKDDELVDKEYFTKSDGRKYESLIINGEAADTKLISSKKEIDLAEIKHKVIESLKLNKECRGKNNECSTTVKKIIESNDGLIFETYLSDKNDSVYCISLKDNIPCSTVGDFGGGKNIMKIINKKTKKELFIKNETKLETGNILRVVNADINSPYLYIKINSGGASCCTEIRVYSKSNLNYVSSEKDHFLLNK